MDYLYLYIFILICFIFAVSYLNTYLYTNYSEKNDKLEPNETTLEPNETQPDAK